MVTEIRIEDQTTVAPGINGPRLGATLLELKAYSWRCELCNVESIEIVAEVDKDHILTMIRIHNQRAQHPLAYGNRAIDRKCPICTAGPGDPCVQGKWPMSSGVHIERWGDLGAPVRDSGSVVPS